MFANHQPIIAHHAQSSPEGLASVLHLAILTAHAPFYRAPGDMTLAARGGEEALGPLFGWKLAAYAGIIEHRAAIWHQCQDLYECRARDDVGRREIADTMLSYLASFHGLGFAKAGFAMQMAYGLSGCLDTHNLKRLGVKPYLVRSRIGERPMTKRTMARRVAMYNATIYRAGGTAKLWDEWCAYVAIRNPKHYKSADHVSKLHCVALGLLEE